MGKILREMSYGLTAAFGALCLGTIIGWSSPAQTEVIEDQGLGYDVSEDDYKWIGSLFVLGAAVACIPVGFIMNAIGRKLSLMLFCIPGVFGYVGLCIGQHIFFGYAGRFLLGIAGGAFCVLIPLYNTEIAEKEIRGMLGTFFQMFITIGICVSYVVGAFTKVFVLSLFCAALFAVFVVMLLFLPESPVYYVSKGKTEKAEASLQRLRGKDGYDAAELAALQAADKTAKEYDLKAAMSRKVTWKAFGISAMMMLFQQLGGINAIMFYSTSIFQNAKSQLEDKYATILIGGIQVVFTLVTCGIIDKTGRKVLLLISLGIQAICCALVGFYFFQKTADQDVSSYAWLPVLAIILYIIGFSLGMGPIPWLLFGEMFTEDAKSLCGSLVATLNWIFAFIVTLLFGPTTKLIGIGATFIIFAGINALGIVFVVFLVPETRNKTIEEVQQKMGASA